MSSLEEIVAIMKKGFEDIQAQMGRQREEIEGLREEIAHDVSAMRSEVDGRLKMHAKAMYDHTNAHMQARLEEAFKTASEAPTTTTPVPRKDKAKVVNLGGGDRATSSKGDYTRVSSPRESHPSQGGSQDDRHENEPLDLQDDEDTRGTPRGPRMAVGREPNPRVNREDRGQEN